MKKKMFSASGPKKTWRAQPSNSPAATALPYTDVGVRSPHSYRQIQARKAKRSARFKVELFREEAVSANRHVQSNGNLERNNLVAYNSTEMAIDDTDCNALSEYEGVVESSASCVIRGLCPDMCPESERAERERKGDLDQFERLHGDRNQTSMFLAVKKYNRTAKRDANLIRPMPILLKTIDYLLNLLNQPYNDRFLSIYNFLWDRMRAIRMDLRMQHIFDQESITVLEQMIRLHIVAMHELCESSRGEGFAEGFDAHLNMEQMNKTSVELFQLYDDHRKKGIKIPTEKEFRGYYALLKLDKHPGYMVEPAELSLDLAKMAPDIRKTSEVLFARDVARACRTGNFIAFFQLARQATYLQACLMHAHFSKLRAQALASIHAGLQHNQGIPIADIAKWLAMEVDETESLSEHHGFVLKAFNEPYMVKEGPYLSGREGYPTKCSKLVEMKKSTRMIEDVLASSQVMSLSPEPRTLWYAERESPVHDFTATEVINSVHEVDEMPYVESVLSPKDISQKHLVAQTPMLGQYREDSHTVAAESSSPWAFSSFTPQPDRFGIMEKPNYNALSSESLEKIMDCGMEEMQVQVESKTALEEIIPAGTCSYGVEHPADQFVAIRNFEDEAPLYLPQEDENNDVMANCDREEIFEAKLKLILRLWKRRSQKLRELREQKQLIANAELNSLSMGPPIQLKRDRRSTYGEFDVDLVLRERYKRHRTSWSRLNVSDVKAGILSRRNPDAGCLASTSSQVIVPLPFSAEATRDQVILQPGKIMHSAAMEEAMPNIDHREDEEENNDVVASHQQEEIVEAKLKLILRLWKRRSLKLRELREQKQLAEITAGFNSVSLGPPIQPLLVDKPRSTSASFDNKEDERLLIRRLIEKCNMPSSTFASFDKKRAERLLLCRSIEQCSMLQNSIDKMLYIYGF